MYKKSKEIFAELDAVSEGNIKRSYVKGSIPFTKDNKVQQFKGVVTLVDIYNKVGFLKCDSLPNFTDELKFFPKYQVRKTIMCFSILVSICVDH